MIPIAGATNQAFIASANGDNAILVTHNGCSVTSSCYTVMSVRINEKELEKDLFLYSNPYAGGFSVNLGENNQSVTISVTDLMGKVIHCKTYHDRQLINLNIKEPAGMYLLIIQSIDTNSVHRLVKE